MLRQPPRLQCRQPRRCHPPIAQDWIHLVCPSPCGPPRAGYHRRSMAISQTGSCTAPSCLALPTCRTGWCGSAKPTPPPGTRVVMKPPVPEKTSVPSSVLGAPVDGKLWITARLGKNGRLSRGQHSAGGKCPTSSGLGNGNGEVGLHTSDTQWRGGRGGSASGSKFPHGAPLIRSTAAIPASGTTNFALSQMTYFVVRVCLFLGDVTPGSASPILLSRVQYQHRQPIDDHALGHCGNLGSCFESLVKEPEQVLIGSGEARRRHHLSLVCSARAFEPRVRGLVALTGTWFGGVYSLSRPE